MPVSRTTRRHLSRCRGTRRLRRVKTPVHRQRERMLTGSSWSAMKLGNGHDAVSRRRTETDVELPRHEHYGAREEPAAWLVECCRPSLREGLLEVQLKLLM